MTSIVSWPYQRTDCAYVLRLYESMHEVADEPLEVTDYRPGRLWRPAPDYLHLHWPETALDHPFYPRALLRALVVLVDIVLMKLRGSTVVWTRHDDGSHKQAHPRSERIFVSLYRRLADGFIHLTQGSQQHLGSYGGRQTVIPHGIGPVGSLDATQRSAAKEALGMRAEPTLGMVGRLQDYKNVVETIDAFATLGYGQLLIAGEPIDPGYRRAIEERSETPGLTLKLGRLEESEFGQCLGACDVVILPYSNHLNSGVAFEAIAAPSRIAVSRSPSMAELVDVAGEQWVRLIDAPPTPALMAELFDWAGQPVDAEAQLSDTWNDVAAETWSYFQSFR